MLNHSPACERNKNAIALQLAILLRDCTSVLEVGSGSGQHVLYFAEQLPHITWQPMDLNDYFVGLEHNLRDSAANILPPIELNLHYNPWLPEQEFDAVYSANTLHIMSWPDVVNFFARAGNQIKAGGKLCIYGPFKYDGQFSSPSNANFELWLKQRDPQSGVRDFEAVSQQAEYNGFDFVCDQAMPANNQLLCFVKR